MGLWKFRKNTRTVYGKKFFYLFWTLKRRQKYWWGQKYFQVSLFSSTRLAQNFQLFETNFLDHNTSVNVGLPFIRETFADLQIWYFLIGKYGIFKKGAISNINFTRECFHVSKNVLKFALQLPSSILFSSGFWIPSINWIGRTVIDSLARVHQKQIDNRIWVLLRVQLMIFISCEQL